MNSLIFFFLPQIHKDAKWLFATFCLGGLLFISCAKKQEKIPDNILSQEKMIQVMVDVHIAEALIQNSNLNLTDSTKKYAARYYKELFVKNKITEQQFRQSFLYYSHHLNLLNKIYEVVIEELSKRQAKNESK